MPTPRPALSALACLFAGVVGACAAHRGAFARAHGAYLGQRPPGLTPEVFAPGLISTKKREGGVVACPGGEELYFWVVEGDGENVRTTIYLTRQRNGAWTNPEPLPFSGTYVDGYIALHPDGSRLYFQSNRPIDAAESPTATRTVAAAGGGARSQSVFSGPWRCAARARWKRHWSARALPPGRSCCRTACTGSAPSRSTGTAAGSTGRGARVNGMGWGHGRYRHRGAGAHAGGSHLLAVPRRGPRLLQRIAALRGRDRDRRPAYATTSWRARQGASPRVFRCPGSDQLGRRGFPGLPELRIVRPQPGEHALGEVHPLIVVLEAVLLIDERIG